MQRNPTTPSLSELLKSGFGSRQCYATSRDFLQFLEGSTLEELVGAALEDEDSWELTLVVEDDSPSSWADAVLEPSRGDDSAPDPRPRLARARG